MTVSILNKILGDKEKVSVVLDYISDSSLNDILIDNVNSVNSSDNLLNKFIDTRLNSLYNQREYDIVLHLLYKIYDEIETIPQQESVDMIIKKCDFYLENILKSVNDRKKDEILKQLQDLIIRNPRHLSHLIEIYEAETQKPFSNQNDSIKEKFDKIDLLYEQREYDIALNYLYDLYEENICSTKVNKDSKVILDNCDYYLNNICKYGNLYQKDKIFEFIQKYLTNHPTAYSLAHLLDICINNYSSEGYEKSLYDTLTKLKQQDLLPSKYVLYRNELKQKYGIYDGNERIEDSIDRLCENKDYDSALKKLYKVYDNSENSDEILNKCDIYLKKIIQSVDSSEKEKIFNHLQNQVLSNPTYLSTNHLLDICINNYGLERYEKSIYEMLKKLKEKRNLSSEHETYLNILKQRYNTSNTKNKASGSNNKLDINKASLNELKSLPGINLILAKKIIQLRDHGNYITSPTDLKHKLNLKSYQIEQIKPYIEITEEYRRKRSHGRKLDL